MKGRAYNLAQAKKHKLKTKKRLKRFGWDCDNIRVGVMSKSKKICSCPVCGNPRKYAKGKERYTIQERKYK